MNAHLYLAAMFGVGLSDPSSAAARTVSEGYTCAATAFSMIGGWDGVGEGQASMFVDAEYRPVSRTLTYSIRDRVTGFGKLTASWPLRTNGSLDAIGAGDVRIPIRANVPDEFTVTVTLDGTPVGTHRFRREGQHIVDLDAAGFAAKGLLGPAIVSEGDHSWLPDLKGHRTISYDIRSNGAANIGETFLLPDWGAADKRVASAFQAAEKLRRQHRCDRTIVLSPR